MSRSFSLKDRPSWAISFIGMAYALAYARSHDEETQHGCVLATENNEIISIGFNGFPRDFPDYDLPTTRPSKYIFMRHSETNSLSRTLDKKLLKGAIAYVSGVPCTDCLLELWEYGIRKVVYLDRPGYGHNEDAKKIEDRLKEVRETLLQRGMILEPIKGNFNWLVEAGNNLNAYI
jgi:dCMP deaminase